MSGVLIEMDSKNSPTPAASVPVVVRSTSALALDPSKSASFGWERIICDVTLEEGKVKRILNNISGLVKPGEMIAIMGPSGSGKTTLLDVLSTRQAMGANDNFKCEGELLVNGHAVDHDTFKHIASYVPQEDSLMGTMTVRETLQFAARLQMPADTTEQGISDRVNAVMSDLGLTECAEAKIGTIFQKGISGGQKRRVSVAVELMQLPQILFLDEVTSGLDSAAAENIVDMLSRLAKGGRTIVCTIHSPSADILFKFDKLLLLSEGNVVYYGKTSEAIAHFAGLGHQCAQYNNPADFFLKLINTDFGAKSDDILRFSQSWKQSVHANTLEQEIKSERASGKTVQKYSGGFNASFFVQTFELAKRTMADNIRNPGVYWVRFFMYFMLSIMIGTSYLNMGVSQKDLQDRIGLLFYVAAFMVFMAIAVIPNFIQERQVFQRERGNGWYSEGAFVIQNTICSLPGLFLIALMSSIIICYLSTISDSSDRFGFFLLALYLALLVSESIMTLLSALVPFYIIGMALGAGMFGMFMLTQGFFLIPKNIPGWWIWAYYWGFHTYAFRLFMVNEFKGRTVVCDTSFCQWTSGDAVLEWFDMAKADKWLDIIILLIHFFGYRFVTYLALKYFRKGR